MTAHCAAELPKKYYQLPRNERYPEHGHFHDHRRTPK